MAWQIENEAPAWKIEDEPAAPQWKIEPETSATGNGDYGEQTAMSKLKSFGSDMLSAWGKGSGNSVRGVGKILQAPIDTAVEMATGLATAVSDEDHKAARREFSQEKSRQAQASREANVAGGNAFAQLGQGMEQVGKDASAYYKFSPELEAQQKEVDAATGFVDKTAALLKNPRVIAATGVQAAPDMALGMGAGKLIGAAGKTQSAQEILASRAGLATEAAQSGMSASTQMEDKVAAMRHGDLYANNPQYRSLIDGGATEAEAKGIVGRALGGEAAALSGLGTAGGSKLTGAWDAMGKTLMRPGPITGKEFLKRAGKEGVEEGVQNPAEGYAQHGATLQVDPNAKYDFGGQVAEGLLSGTPMGAVTHGAGYVGEKINPSDNQSIIARALRDIVDNGEFVPPTPQQVAEASASKADAREMAITGKPVMEQNQQPTGMPIAPLQQEGGMPTAPVNIDASTWSGRGENVTDRKWDLNHLKGKRQMAEDATVGDDEVAALSRDSQLHGVAAEDAVAEARKIKLNYPVGQGWAQPVAVGVEPKGSTLNDRIKFQTIPYSFHVPPSGKKADAPAWANEVADRMTTEMAQLTERAKTDPDAASIIDHMTWYREMARRLRQEFGGFGDVFADLLGATSPNTPVRTNWNFSVDVLRRFVRGEFDPQLAAMEKHLAAGGNVEQFKKGADLITQITGKKYGMNSDKAMKALLGMWRSVKAGDAPKARNFALNLIGQSDKATIDVWAARMLQRLSGGKRIPPRAEGAVAGSHLVDPSKVGGQFGFGQEVFAKVAENLRAQGIDVTAPDLQAVAWFMEKEIWTKNGWTRGLGSEGSFEQEADKMPTDRYQVGATVAQYEHTPTDPEMAQAGQDFTASLANDKQVYAYRSVPTVGMYAGDAERSFDTEVVAAQGWNPDRLVADVARAAKAAGQYDVFVSRALDMDEDNPNWRPGIEVYFKNAEDAAKAEAVISKITKHGIDGFTLIKDPREMRTAAGADTGNYIGLRLQFIPEIFMRWADQSDPAQKAELDILSSGDQNAISGLLEAKMATMSDAVAEMSQVTEVAYASVVRYDTVVIGKENYDDYTGTTGQADQGAGGSRVFTGQSAAQVLQAAVGRLGIEAAGNGQAAVPDGRTGQGLPVSELQQGESRSYFGPESLGIPRNDMPQVAMKLRPAMLEWMKSHGIQFERRDVQADSLKPSQAEFMESKVQKAASLVGDNTDNSAVLVSADGYVIDGHHRWLAKARAHQTINAIVFNKPIREMLKATGAFAQATAHLKAESKHNYTPPPMQSFIPGDVMARADEYVEKFYANRPDLVIADHERAQAEALLTPLVAKANEAKRDYDNKVVAIAERTPAIGQMLAPVKGMKRAIEKLVTDENFNIDGMKDILRSTIVVSSYAHADEVVAEIRKEFNLMRVKNRSGFQISGDLVQVTDRSVFGGYSDVLVNVRMDNGVIAEIQINIPEMLSVKADHGHKLYEAAREVGKETPLGQDIYSAMTEIYDIAYEFAAITQAGGLSESPSAPRGNPRAGESALPSSENLKNLAPGNSTKSSPLEVMMNRQPGGNGSETFIGDTSFSGIMPQNSLQQDATQQQAGATFVYGPIRISDGKSNLPAAHFAPALSERDMARRSLAPLEKKQAGVIDSALGDLFGTGRLPEGWVGGVNFYGLGSGGRGFANYNPKDRAIGVQTYYLDSGIAGEEHALRYIRGWLAHELHHGIDNYRTSATEMFYLSAESPRMDMAWDGEQWVGNGDLMAEAISEWASMPEGDEVRLFLNYPMAMATAMAMDGEREAAAAAAFAKIEMFAQMGAMYVTNPDLMQATMPTWFAFFKEWNDARGTGSIERSRVSLRNLLQKPVSQHPNQGGVGGTGVAARPVGQNQQGTLSPAGGPRVGANAPGRGNARGSAVLPAPAQAVAGRGTLSLYQSLASGKVPGNNHIPTHVNYSTFSSPQELKSLYAGMSDKFEKEIQAQRRGVISIKETYADARRMIEDEAGLSAAKVDSMLHREPGTAAGAAEIMARMAILEAATGAVDRMATKIKGQGALQTTEQEWLDFAAAIDRANMAHQTFLGARAEVGRAMNAIKAYAGDYNASDIDAILKTYNGKDGLAKVAEAIAATSAAGGRQGANGGRSGSASTRAGSGRANAIARLAKAAAKPTITDAFIEAWKAGLLSGPATHMANIIGNTVFTLMRIPETALAGTIGALTRGDKAHLGDAISLTTGMIVGANQGLRAAWEVLKDEDATIGPTAAEDRQHAISGETFGASGKLGALLDVMGKAVRTPYRALGAEDAVFKMMNMYGSLYSEATAQAMREGKAGWPNGFAHRVAEIAKAAERHMLDPTGLSGPMPYDPVARTIAEQAIKDGLTYTFQNKLGAIGQLVERGRSEFKVLHGILPFVRTPLNIFRQSIERTPLAFMSKQWREDVKAGGHNRDLALARAILGTTVMSAVVSAVAGGMMTGGGDPEKDARKRRQELGIPDYAINIGGKWYEYRRIEPLGTLMGAAADYVEVMNNATNEEGGEHVPKQIAAAFTQAVTNKTYMKALADLANVFSDPERYGDSYVAGYFGSVVPAGMAQYAQRQDMEDGRPVVRETKVMGEGKTGVAHMKENATNAIQARIPKTEWTPEFNRQSLPARVDSWGETKKTGAAVFPGAPIRYGEETADKVRKEAARLGVKGTTFTPEAMGVKLDGHQSEKAAREGGQLAHSIVASIVSLPSYDALPNYIKKSIFDAAIKEGHAYGKGIIITPEIIDQHVDKVLKGFADVEQ